MPLFKYLLLIGIDLKKKLVFLVFAKFEWNIAMAKLFSEETCHQFSFCLWPLSYFLFLYINIIVYVPSSPHLNISLEIALSSGEDSVEHSVTIIPQLKSASR